jgi:uncharacterized protein YcbX
VTKFGLKHKTLIDRQMMVIEAATGHFVTARVYPKLILVGAGSVRMVSAGIGG